MGPLRKLVFVVVSVAGFALAAQGQEPAPAAPVPENAEAPPTAQPGKGDAAAVPTPTAEDAKAAPKAEQKATPVAG